MLRNKKLMSNIKAFESFDGIKKEIDDILKFVEEKDKERNIRTNRSNSIESYVDINYKKYVYRKKMGKKLNEEKMTEKNYMT